MSKVFAMMKTMLQDSPLAKGMVTQIIFSVNRGWDGAQHRRTVLCVPQISI